MTLKSDAKFKGKLICGLKNNIRNLNNHASSQKSENLHFDCRRVTRGGEGVEAFPTLFQKLEKSAIIWRKNALIVVIYG